MTPGTIVVNVEDGRRGVIVEDEGRKFVSYSHAGTRMRTRLDESWGVESLPRWQLRPEERRYVALWADRTLRSLEQHRPDGHWRPIDGAEPVYDEGLVNAIISYLESRDR